MFEIREEKTYIYLDENIKDFSSLSAGLLIAGLGQGIKIAYINPNPNAKKLTNFIENLSLNYSFVRNLNIRMMGIFMPKSKEIITKTILPQVEYLNMTKDMFWKDLDNFEIIIFDNLNLEGENSFEKIKLISLLKNKNPKTQIIAITPEKKVFENLKSEFNNAIKCELQKNNGLTKIKGITTIYGSSQGKSIFAYGELLRGFLYKADVKLIYFNKPYDNYGDITFFKYLKKWQFENSFYGTFDYVQTGAKPTETQEKKVKEAKEALMLLKTSLKKQSPVIADEILNIINENLLTSEEINEVLRNTNNQVILTGDIITNEIKNISENLIEFKRIE